MLYLCWASTICQIHTGFPCGCSFEKIKWCLPKLHKAHKSSFRLTSAFEVSATPMPSHWLSPTLNIFLFNLHLGSQGKLKLLGTWDALNILFHEKKSQIPRNLVVLLGQLHCPFHWLSHRFLRAGMVRHMRRRYGLTHKKPNVQLKRVCVCMCVCE